MAYNGFLRSLSLTAILLFSLILVFPPSYPDVNAQLVGVVCTADVSSASCPATPTVFSGAAGTQLEVAVNIQDSDSFNGFDIFIKADINFLDGLSIDIGGSVLGLNLLVLAQCIDNSGQGCGAAQNGQGIVRVAAVSIGSATTPPTTGRLFSIKYKILSDISGILVGFQNGCSETSVPPDFCVTVVRGTTIIPETVQPAQIGGRGDFTITAGPTSFTIRKGSFAVSRVLLESIDGFFSGIGITITVTPSRPTGPLVTIQPSVFLPPYSSTSLMLRITTGRTTPVGEYIITVTATSGELSHSVAITVRVLPPLPPPPPR